MRPRTKADNQARLNAILTRLDEMFPNVTCVLDHSTPWGLLVATILNAQCMDERVNKVAPALNESSASTRASRETTNSRPMRFA